MVIRYGDVIGVQRNAMEKERKVRHDTWHTHRVVYAWSKLAKSITCRNHGTSSTVFLPVAAAGTKRSSEGIQIGDVMGV